LRLFEDAFFCAGLRNIPEEHLLSFLCFPPNIPQPNGLLVFLFGAIFLPEIFLESGIISSGFQSFVG